MLKPVLMNLAALIFLLALSMAYVSYVADQVPSESALLINLILVPMLLGILVFFLIQGPLYIAVLILAVLPIAHVIFLGGDPAKPGLERFVALLEFLFLCLGLAIAYLGRRYFFSQ